MAVAGIPALKVLRGVALVAVSAAPVCRGMAALTVLTGVRGGSMLLSAGEVLERGPPLPFRRVGEEERGGMGRRGNGEAPPEQPSSRRADAPRDRPPRALLHALAARACAARATSFTDWPPGGWSFHPLERGQGGQAQVPLRRSGLQGVAVGWVGFRSSRRPPSCRYTHATWAPSGALGRPRFPRAPERFIS